MSEEPQEDISRFGPSGLAFGILCSGVIDGELRFNFYCKRCGGWVLTTDDDPPTDNSQVRCKACDHPFGLLWKIWGAAALAAREAGYPVPDRLDPQWRGP